MKTENNIKKTYKSPGLKNLGKIGAVTNANAIANPNSTFDNQNGYSS